MPSAATVCAGVAAPSSGNAVTDGLPDEFQPAVALPGLHIPTAPPPPPPPPDNLRGGPQAKLPGPQNAALSNLRKGT